MVEAEEILGLAAAHDRTPLPARQEDAILGSLRRNTHLWGRGVDDERRTLIAEAA
ncbi:hypothetical protein [Streptomyces coelicoflavus]|uniref:hypothetical protein n=1 Tax=Streptomyces coelicoflavus TaxID=285562 RepID=UPI00369A9FA3